MTVTRLKDIKPRAHHDDDCTQSEFYLTFLNIGQFRPPSIYYRPFCTSKFKSKLQIQSVLIVLGI